MQIIRILFEILSPLWPFATILYNDKFFINAYPAILIISVFDINSITDVYRLLLNIIVSIDVYYLCENKTELEEYLFVLPAAACAALLSLAISLENINRNNNNETDDENIPFLCTFYIWMIISMILLFLQLTTTAFGLIILFVIVPLNELTILYLGNFLFMIFIDVIAIVSIIQKFYDICIFIIT